MVSLLLTGSTNEADVPWYDAGMLLLAKAIVDFFVIPWWALILAAAFVVAVLGGIVFLIIQSRRQ